MKAKNKKIKVFTISKNALKMMDNSIRSIKQNKTSKQVTL